MVQVVLDVAQRFPGDKTAANGRKHFPAMYGDILGRVHAQPHFVPANFDNSDGNVVTDVDDFILLAR